MASTSNFDTSTRRFGKILIWIGLAGFFSSAILPLTIFKDSSSIPAVAIFLMLFGMAFYFPDLLEDPSKQKLSTMRMVIFMLVSVFCILIIKIGWNAQSFDEFKVDRTWVYILGFALGGKVLQSFAEEPDAIEKIKRDMQPKARDSQEKERQREADDLKK